MNIPTPVFTTSYPGPMCDTSDANDTFIKMMQTTGVRKILHTTSMKRVYIDGILETLLGYDIPIFLDGTITGETQDCIVWNVEGTIAYAAEITYNHYMFSEDNPHTFIRMKSLPTI